MTSPSLRVLHVYRTYFPDPPGGLQEAIRQICGATQPFYIENTIFTLSTVSEPSALQRPEARVVRCHSWMAPASCDIGGVGAFMRFRELAKAADVVHYHFPWPFADVMHLSNGCSTPSVLTYHSDVVRQRFLGALYRPLMMRMLSSMSAVVATSPAYARTSETLSAPDVQKLVRVIPLGIDERSYPSDGDEHVLRRLSIRDEPYFLFIGVLRYYKGLHFLLEAALRVGAKVVIAGSGPEDAALRALVETLGVRNVVLAGQVSVEEKVALLRYCRALVLPSHLRSEAFGMVLVEAAMLGVPMISCEIGTGTTFVNADGETGFVVERAKPAALADAMNRLLADEALAVRMGLAARERYERLFSGEALGREYAALYREVAGC
ncbi:glycosyltransferase [Aromatoleum toluclasticum]|uniref:glycosyltransferase n=1 Tax=Aromatoleum toluclasticum TaxID=92003 RepID=UPI001D180275|nr:glycosyltransferase [Aromatoleum toluclasticum]MCC4117942.1 glycosyltransferase [Aromatoleum toluclasticum]